MALKMHTRFDILCLRMNNQCGDSILNNLTLHHLWQVYLVDYGLAYRYNPGGDHKGYDEDPRRRHDGTIEFTSIDAHNGACMLSLLLCRQLISFSLISTHSMFLLYVCFIL